MEDHETTQKTSTNPSISSSSTQIKYSDQGQDLPPPPAAAHGGDEVAGETWDPKKRKSSPSVVDKCESHIKKKKNSLLNSNNSFTFDTRFCGGSGSGSGSGFGYAPESTPKFGSFNSGSSTSKKKDGEERDQ